jgi:hypothetical protein
LTVCQAYAAVGTYTVLLTVRDGDGGVGTQSQSVSPPTIHVGDLDRASTSQGGGWTATVMITVHDGSHAPVANAAVTGAWAGSGTGSCATSANGQCAVSRSGIPKKTGSVTFTVVDATRPGVTYASVANHDPDGDSNGTSITVNKP